MYRISRDRLKTYVLVILILTSFIQVGILWDKQVHGLPPFSFIMGFFQDNASNTSDDFFTPYQIVVSAGAEESRWILNERNNPNEYKELWKDAKAYLEGILSSNIVQQKATLGLEEWTGTVLKRAFIYEFKAQIDQNLLAWFMDIPKAASADPPALIKMAILPWENDNNYNTIYINDNKQVYKYVLQFNSSQFNREKYNGVIERLERDNKLRTYGVISEKFQGHQRFKELFPNRQDLPIIYVGGEEKFTTYNNIICLRPESFEIKNPNKMSELDKLAENILGKEKDTYLRTVVANDAVEFKTQNNLYTVYKDGLLEYRYMSDSSGVDKGNISEAFQQALTFITARKGMISGVEMYISRIRETQNAYEFTFDYKFEGTPIYFNYKINSEDGDVTLNNAITLTANSKRVLNCQWIMKKFTQGQQENRYDVTFTSFLESAFNKYPKLDKGLAIKDVSISYEAESGLASQDIEPVWVILSTEDKYYSVPIEKSR